MSSKGFYRAFVAFTVVGFVATLGLWVVSFRESFRTDFSLKGKRWEASLRSGRIQISNSPQEDIYINDYLRMRQLVDNVRQDLKYRDSLIR